MTSPLRPESAEMRKRFYAMYREFFDRAEKKRRWSLNDDIPWDQCNPNLNPAIADVVESFCAVELYLPDYVSKALPMIRANKGWAWFHCNWGYEESKHSLALNDWLLRSKARTEEQMADLEDKLFQHEWNVPHDDPAAMVIYASVQELATWLHYKNLLKHVTGQNGCPALAQLLQFIAVDERSHHAFYADIVKMFLSIDRRETLALLRRVLLTFRMPAVHMLGESAKRVEQIKNLGIFDEDMFMHEVYRPLLDTLGIDSKELRERRPEKKSTRKLREVAPVEPQS